MSTATLATLRDMSHCPDWPTLLEQAAAIVKSYDTSVTLRQLFYRLMAATLLPNTTNAYKSLSKYTAKARRAGTFPALMDRGRTIHRYTSFGGAAEARKWLVSIYRRDRTEGQRVSVYLGVEKAGIVAQLQEWFGDLGVPVLALGGYGSQTYVDEVVADVAAWTARPYCSTLATTTRAARTRSRIGGGGASVASARPGRSTTNAVSPELPQ